MLVLTRHAQNTSRPQESIFIGANIEIFVIVAENGKARIGINAPPEIPIRRSEHPQTLVQASTVPEEMNPAFTPADAACEVG